MDDENNEDDENKEEELELDLELEEEEEEERDDEGVALKKFDRMVPLPFSLSALGGLR